MIARSPPRLALLVLACAAAWPRSARAEARTLTVEDAVRLARESDPRLRASALQAGGARDLQRSSRGRLLPSIHLSEEYLHYDRPYAVGFPVPGAPGGSVGFPARKQDTNTLVVSADQPLLGLVHATAELHAQESAADAAEAEVETEEARVRAEVQTDYLRLSEARALEEIARTSEAELAEQVRVATERVAVGRLTKADLLRAEVALASAKQQEIAAQAQSVVARGALLTAIGLPIDDGATEFAEPVTLLAKARLPAPPLVIAETQALARRPELAERRHKAASAAHQRAARAYALLPEIDAEGAYMQMAGQPFVPENAAYVGVKVTWAVWEWGASYYAARAAAAEEAAARKDLEDERRAVALEASSDLAQIRSSTSAVDLAAQTIASAEEAYRVTAVSLQNGSATTTDLLDAQAALARARLDLTRARYDQALAYVTLAHAIGE